MVWLRCHCNNSECGKLIELTPFEEQLVNNQSLVPVLNGCFVNKQEMEPVYACKGFWLCRVKMSVLHCECGRNECGLKLSVPPEVMAQLDDSEYRLRAIVKGCQFGSQTDWELKEERNDFSIYIDKKAR